MAELRKCLSCTKKKCKNCSIYEKHWWQKRPLERVETILQMLKIPYDKTTVERGIDLGDAITTGTARAIIVFSAAGNTIFHEADMGYVWVHKNTLHYGINTIGNIPRLIKEVIDAIES